MEVGRRRAPRRPARRPVELEARIEARRRAAAGAAPRDCLVVLDLDTAILDSLAFLHGCCLGPAFAARFGRAQAVNDLAALWNKVALGSRLRGAEPFRILAAALRLCSREEPTAARRRRNEALAASLEAWLGQEEEPSAARLEQALRAARVDPRLSRALEWFRAAEAVGAELPLPRPFRGAAEAVRAISGSADLAVLAEEGSAAARRAWSRFGLAGTPSFLPGGPAKAGRSLEELARRYPRGSVAVVGSSLACLNLAKRIGASFLPIEPGREAGCWEELGGRFAQGRPLLSAPEGRVADFLSSLPAPAMVPRGSGPRRGATRPVRQ